MWSIRRRSVMLDKHVLVIAIAVTRVALCAIMLNYTGILGVGAATSAVPLAEIVFAPYNINMAGGYGEKPPKNPVGVNQNEDFCFISHGCWGSPRPQTKKHREVADLIGRLIEEGDSDPSQLGGQIRFVVAAGDNFYGSGVTSIYDELFFTTFEDFYAHTGEEGQVRRIPWIVALGNHDHMGNWVAQVNYTYAPKESEKYSRLWGHLSNSSNLVLGRWYMPKPYYALKVSHDMVLVVIDTVLLHLCATSDTWKDCWDTGAQKKIVEHWLLREYADVPYKVVIGHYPVLSNGPHENFEWLQKWLIPLMEKSCVSIYIHADNHYLQVSKRGSQYYANSGGGSRLHYPFMKGMRTMKESIFHVFKQGVMLHCKQNGQFTHRVIDSSGKVVFRFVSWEGGENMSLKKCMANQERKTFENSDKICLLLFLLFVILVVFTLCQRQWRRYFYWIKLSVR